MKAHNRQSFVDISVQACGSVEAMFDFAAANEVSITDEPVQGVDYNVPPTDNVNVTVTGRYSTQGYKPATAIEFTQTAAWGGINYMGIEIDFIVS